MPSAISRKVIAPGPTSRLHDDVVHESPLDLIPVDLRGSKQVWINSLLKLLPDEWGTSLVVRTVSSA